MRISSSQFFQTGINSLNTQQADLMHLFQQIGSGQRMVTPADDPLGAAQAINIGQAQALNTRHGENRAVLNTNLAAEEDALRSATLLMQDLKSRLVEVGNGTISDADRESLGTVLQSMRETLMGIANRTDGNGQYLFSGHAGSQPAFDESTGAWMNHTGQRLIQADATRQIAGNDLGSDVFAKAPTGSRAYVTSAIPVANSTGNAHIAAPVVMDATHPVVGQSFKVTYTYDALNDSYSYDLTDLSGNPITDPSSTPPVTDVVARVENGKLSIVDQSDPAAEKVILQTSFSGTPADGDAFTIEAASSGDLDMNIFATLDSLVAALGNGTGSDFDQAAFSNALSSAMQKIDLNYDQLLSVRASVGTRMNEVESLNASGSQRALGYSNRLSKLEDVNYYAVSAQLQLRTAALEAASLAFRQIQSTSLFNMTN